MNRSRYVVPIVLLAGAWFARTAVAEETSVLVPSDAAVEAAVKAAVQDLDAQTAGGVYFHYGPYHVHSHYRYGLYPRHAYRHYYRPYASYYRVGYRYPLYYTSYYSPYYSYYYPRVYYYSPVTYGHYFYRYRTPVIVVPPRYVGCYYW